MRALYRDGKALSDALKRYGYPVSDAAWRNTNNGATMSVEARALHRAAETFNDMLADVEDAAPIVEQTL